MTAWAHAFRTRASAQTGEAIPCTAGRNDDAEKRKPCPYGPAYFLPFSARRLLRRLYTTRASLSVCRFRRWHQLRAGLDASKNAKENDTRVCKPMDALYGTAHDAKARKACCAPLRAHANRPSRFSNARASSARTGAERLTCAEMRKHRSSGANTKGRLLRIDYS